MPRFTTNRWLTFILTIAVLFTVLTYASSIHADPMRDYSGDWAVGGGAPPPSGAGDPDSPTPTTLKWYARGKLASNRATLSSRSAGDSRVAGNVWMWRLSVMGRVLRSYWVRL